MPAVWNVTRGGKVVGTVEDDSYLRAQALAIAQHGHGAHVSAPADPDSSTSVNRPRGRSFDRKDEA